MIRDDPDDSSWEVITMPDENNKWNPPVDLPPSYEDFDVTSLVSGVSQIALPTVPESPFFRQVIIC